MSKWHLLAERAEEGHVRTVKEGKQARGTHFLESGKGETSQNGE